MRTPGLCFFILSLLVTAVHADCLSVCELFCVDKVCGLECNAITDPGAQAACFQECGLTCKDDCARDCDPDMVPGLDQPQYDPDVDAPIPVGGSDAMDGKADPLSSGDLCYGVCHKYCIVPCSQECGPEKDCVISCYDGCGDECSVQCGAMAPEEMKKSWTFEFWAMMGFFALVMMSFGGWYISRVQRKENISLIDEIGSVFEKNRSHPKACRAELEALREKVKAEYRANRIDETTFNSLLGMIEEKVRQLQR